MPLLNYAILLLITTSTLIEACLVNIAQKSLQNHWDYLEIPRKTDKNCECGRFDPDNWTSPWNLYVHVNSGSQAKTCTGTIITSNLVVTSHKCLELKSMRLYDMLKLKLGESSSMAEIEQVTVTTGKASSTTTFKIVDIFYNPQYAISSEKGLYPENDLVLIKVEENLLTAGFTPICVPFFDEEKIANVEGFYYGHSIEKSNTNTRPVQESDVPHRYFGVILEKRECYKQLYILESDEMKQKCFDKTLCFRFGMLEKHRRMEGGPLIYAQSNTTAYLTGVSTVISLSPTASGFEASTGQERAYFSSIKSLVKFIEFYADQGKDKSIWCRTPKLKLVKVPSIPSGDSLGPTGTWPWQELEEPIQREESLNCECGIQTSHAGRIVGGSEVAQREYGWMAVLFIYRKGRGQGGSICGGSIINDRIILTAAHCVVSDEKVYQGHHNVNADPADIDVILNAHRRHGDSKGIKVKVAAVLFHPDYLYGRKRYIYETDVALVILKDKLTFPEKGPGIRPICLHKMGPYVEVVGKKATVAGWGLLDPEDQSSLADKLMQIEVPIANMSLCKSIKPSYITDNFLCAGTLDRYRDAASGDSGGPLMIQDEQTGQWTEVGIVSYGNDEQGHPTKTAALYSDVQKLLPFIDYHAQRVGSQWCRSP